MQSNGYGNSAVNSVWATKTEAQAKCKEMKESQERYDNHYYVVEQELQGDTCAFLDEDRDNQPCCYCAEHSCWVKGEEDGT